MAKNITVLLIEDDPDQIFLYQSKFELEGFTFLSSRRGEEGIWLAQTNKPDVILLDLVLIAENGLDVLEQLKKNSQTQHIPVIVLTNLVKTEAMERAKNLGAAGFLVKTDVMPSAVVQKVRDVLKT